MAKSIIEIIHVVPLSGVGKKSGNAYDMRFAQCIVHHVNKETASPNSLRSSADGFCSCAGKGLLDGAQFW